MALVSSACVTTGRPRVPITLPVTAWPQETQVRWYDIEGDTETQLRSSLDTHGPQDESGDRNDAYTSWYVTWHYAFDESPEGCGIGPVSTQVRVTVTLPRWKGFAEEHHPLNEHWRKYLEALRVHESGHREHGFQAAVEITDSLPTLPRLPTCDAAELAANEAARSILQRYKQRDVDYDEETRHGATQGALFP